MNAVTKVRPQSIKDLETVARKTWDGITGVVIRPGALPEVRLEVAVRSVSEIGLDHQPRGIARFCRQTSKACIFCPVLLRI
jgi:hypothetical protein